ncbi:MAG: hypothetical protein ACJ74Z_13525 [Bryobacteraceae bacterium]
MSCAAFTILGVIVLAFNKSNRWALWATFGAAVVMLFVGSFLAWRDQYARANAAGARIAATKADFVVDVPHITVFTNAKTETYPVILLFTIEVVNRGHDSIARHWKGHYRSGATEHDLLIEAITDMPLTVRHGTVEQIIKSEDVIYNKTRFPVTRGSMANGVLVVHLSRGEWTEVVSRRATLTVMVEDYLGNRYSSAPIEPIESDGFRPYPGVDLHTRPPDQST